MGETSCRAKAYIWDHVLNKCSVSVNHLVCVCVCVCTYSLSVPSSLKVGPIGSLETSIINFFYCCTVHVVTIISLIPTHAHLLYTLKITNSH
jgi:hypothetical protein